MKGSFEYAFPKVISVEGGFVNDPKDPGGATKFGISQRAYPKEDIKNLTIDRAKELYRADYWDRIHGDDLPDPLSHFVFDAAVNQGVSAAIHMLQTALKVAVDLKIGPSTLAAAKASNNDTCARFMTLRARRYMFTINADRYLDGWFNRLFIMAMN